MADTDFELRTSWLLDHFVNHYTVLVPELEPTTFVIVNEFHICIFLLCHCSISVNIL